MLNHLAKNMNRTHLDGSTLLISKIAYDGNNNPEYMGVAPPGSATSAAAWLIKKIAYDGNQNPTSILMASGNINFDKVWDDRAAYSYS